jgi:hypothetical protein
MSLTYPPPAPSTADPENFDTKADAFLAWITTFITELNAVLGATIPAGSAAANTLTGDTLAPNVLTASIASILGALAIAGGVKTASGTSALTLSGSAADLFNISTTGAYFVFAYLSNAGAQYNAASIVLCDGTNVSQAVAYNGANMTITTSGSGVKATQSAGSPQTVSYSYLKIL